MKQELWLSRDKTGDGDYEIHGKEPTKNDIGEYHSFDGRIDSFESEIFHRIFKGARLRKGRKKRIKRILIELED